MSAPSSAESLRRKSGSRSSARSSATIGRAPVFPPARGLGVGDAECGDAGSGVRGGAVTPSNLCGMTAQPSATTKRDRQRAILDIVGAHVVGSQEELRRHLHGRGWDVTQSTLSRDLHELRLARVPTNDGMRYVTTGGANGTNTAAEQARAALASLLPQLFDRLDGVGELVVVHTVPSGAQPIAAALDASGWPDVIGTIGGDDTVLIICRSADGRARVAERLEQLAAA
ncbi:hypothetical protein tb265_13340 [Gemmatimonadetes bacterium T265]|nr:hypothetical protein tb265_13340 [Gemmatimonadetes bacterium T265]